MALLRWIAEPDMNGIRGGVGDASFSGSRDEIKLEFVLRPRAERDVFGVDDPVAVQVFLPDLKLVILRLAVLRGEIDHHRRPAIRAIGVLKSEALDKPGH